jgi:hypothetical protein
MTTNYENEARILLDALNATLGGKMEGGGLTPGLSGFRYIAPGFEHPIGFVFVNGIINAQSEGLPSSQGGFQRNRPATVEGARELAEVVIADVKKRAKPPVRP